MEPNLLYCASQSYARHELLTQAQIPFKVISISVEEEDAQPEGSVEQQVEFLAKFKHIGVDVPALIEAHEESKKPIYILTADTLIAGSVDGILYGKPKDYDDARAMLRAVSSQDIIVATGMCFSVWQYHAEEEGWYNPIFTSWACKNVARYSIPDDEIEAYLARCPVALKACASTAIEGIGSRYFHSLKGSYSSVVGLDIPGLHKRLKESGFYKPVAL